MYTKRPSTLSEPEIGQVGQDLCLKQGLYIQVLRIGQGSDILERRKGVVKGVAIQVRTRNHGCERTN